MTLYLSHQDTIDMDIRMKDVVPVFEQAYRIIAEGEAATQARVRLVHPPLTDGMGTGRPWTRDLRILPAMLPGMGTACRLGGTARGYGSGVALIYWDFETMELRCIISDELVHGVRSAAPDGPLTSLLAKKDSHVLGVIGSGRIARWATEAAWSQRPIDTIKVYSRDPANRADFCQLIGQRLGTRMVDCASSDDAVSGSDVVVMATATREPVIHGEAISPGCTVISNTPEEFDHASVRRANRIVTTSVDEVMTHIPPMQAIYDLIKSGELPSPNGGLVEITDIIGGREPGRTSDDEIIICFNAGTGIHDVAAGKYVYERARELGIGTDLPV